MQRAKIICVYDDIKFANPIIYVFNLFSNVLGVKCSLEPYTKFIYYGSMIEDALIISYGKTLFPLPAKYRIHIYQSMLFSKFYKTARSMPTLPLSSWKDLPIIYEGCGSISSPVIQKDNLIETNIDIIASSFFMLSRYEEVITNERDQYGRFSAKSSIAYKEGFLIRPIVNEYIELLWNWITSLGFSFQRKKLWNEFDFVACLTHDVDVLRKWSKKGIYAEILKYGYIAIKNHKIFNSISGMVKSLESIFSFKDPYWNLMDIINIERQFGFNSSFYFFGVEPEQSEMIYSVRFSKLSNLIREIQEKRCEVGLHGSFHSYNNLDILKKEKKSLEKISANIYSSRQHALLLDIQKTFAIYEKLGIKYDTTLGYADHEGFRAGFCMPFFPYYFDEDRAFNILEFPLVIMDYTLRSRRYRNLSVKDAWQSIESIIEKVRNVNGCIVLLFHNSCLDSFENAENMNIYKKCLNWISKKNGIGLSVKSIIEKFFNYNYLPYNTVKVNKSL